MKHYLLAISCALLLGSGAWAQDAGPLMSKLAWITGCWRGGDSPQIEEQWTKVAGHTMLGVGRTIRDGETTSYEFLQIREKGVDVFYIAQPEGREAVSFKLVKLSDSEAIFENKQHDFPQRIIYQRQVDGSLIAAIEGEEAGKAKRVVFLMQRARCD